MSYPIDRGFGYPGSPGHHSVEDLAEEMVHARTKFPSNKFLLAACMEELGETAEALMEPRWKDDYHVEIRKEAKQTACVAMRLVEEGDGAFDHDNMDEASGMLFAHLVAEVGQLARCLLQRRDVQTRVGNVIRYANQIGREGDPMFADVAEEHAKP